MKLVIYEDWQKLIGDSGNILLEGHRLEPDEVLCALGYDVEIEYAEED